MYWIKPGDKTWRLRVGATKMKLRPSVLKKSFHTQFQWWCKPGTILPDSLGFCYDCAGMNFVVLVKFLKCFVSVDRGW